MRPPGVLPRHRYALDVVLLAWLLAAPRPVGEARHDEAVYALVGVDRRLPGPEAGRAGRLRWRSLSRWAGAIPTWWPTRPSLGDTWRDRVASLLTGFLPGDDDRGGAIRRALIAHTAGGRPM